MINRYFYRHTVYRFTILACIAFISCDKKEIQFGSGLPDSFTRLLSIDTVTPFLSTVLLDSFPTSGNSVLQVGRYVDPLLGPTIAQTFFQTGLPAAAINASLPDDAIYDSLVLVLQPKNSWYGDTSKPITFSAYEMSQQADYTYASRMFNTTTFPWLPMEWASVTRALSPSRDSLVFKIRNDKGMEMFQKIHDKDPAFQTDESFQNYLKGITIRVNAQDKGAVYSFKTDSGTVMRLHYHVTNPYFEKRTIEFFLTRNTYQFNQVLTDRTNTPLEKKYDGQEEYFPDENHPYAFTQTGTGVMMKIKFPSLQDIKTLGKTVKLLSAQLILKPVEGTFGPYDFPLAPSLYMAQTNASNLIGDAVPDASGENVLTATPVIDEIYRLNTNYSFDVTHYITFLLASVNSAEMGVFVLGESPGSSTRLNRAVIGNKQNPKWTTQLKLTVLTTTE